MIGTKNPSPYDPIPMNRAQRRRQAQAVKRDARTQARSRARIERALNGYQREATA